MPLSPQLVTLFGDYEASHAHPVNVRLHKVAIPLIVFHILAMLDWVRVLVLPGPGGHAITLAHIGYIGVVAWYLSLDRPLGLCMAALLALCFPLAWWTPRPAVIAVALIAWTLQLVGHKAWEKRQPAFLHNLRHALVGPLYFVAVALGRWRPATLRRA